MNAACLLMKSLSVTGPARAPLRPCCVAALIALHDRDEPDGIWLCPTEEQENDLAVRGSSS